MSSFSFTQTLEGEPPKTKEFYLDDSDYESKVITYPMRWMISDYRVLRLKSGCAIRSVPFRLGPKDEHEVCLALYPRGAPNSRTDEIASIYMQYLSGSESWITGKISFKIDNQETKETLIGVDTFLPSLGWGIREFCTFHQLSGKSYIYCILSYIVSKSCLLKKKIEHQVRVSEDFGSLLESALFSDVTIVIGGRELKAHKLVLAARSPVFKAMLESDMSEKTTNTINITDIEVKVMQQLLTYIYTGKLNEVVDTAEGLLVAADKYCMEELKTECGEVLCRNVSVDNAARLFLLAEMHGDRGLRNKSVEYIKMNMRAVKSTDDWKSLKEANCKLIVETFVE